MESLPEVRGWELGLTPGSTGLQRQLWSRQLASLELTLKVTKGRETGSRGGVQRPRARWVGIHGQGLQSRAWDKGTGETWPGWGHGGRLFDGDEPPPSSLLINRSESQG